VTREARAAQGLSLRIPAGTSCAVVGTSGSGKSTLLRLLFRFYDPRGGAVRVGGHDIRDLRLQSLRDMIGIVPQARPAWSARARGARWRPCRRARAAGQPTARLCCGLHAGQAAPPQPHTARRAGVCALGSVRWGLGVARAASRGPHGSADAAVRQGGRRVRGAGRAAAVEGGERPGRRRAGARRARARG